MKNFLCFFMLASLACTTINAQVDWSQKYDELSGRVKNHENQPPASEKQLEENLHWMGVHASDRDDVAALIEQLHPLAIEDPDGDHAQWERLFIDLQKRAEKSGRSALSNGCYHHLKVEELDNSYCGWYTSIWRAKRNGRALYLRAIETHFDETLPRDKVECLIKNAILDIEDNEGGMGIYYGRERHHGYIDDEGYSRFWEHDFVIYCERRDKFYVYSEGEPLRPISWAFENIQKIREECDWWNFPDLHQDATDLMNQYYEDALCKQPPHKIKHGHHYFLELARQYELNKSIEFNEGFYGTLYGKVEILDGEMILPAEAALVRVQDHGQDWMVLTDENGYYEIPDIILHKDCSPFNIKAAHNGDWVNDTYEGILTEPDPTARLEKNLIIKRNREYTWVGSLSLLHSYRLNCSIEKPDSGYGIINKTDHRFQNIKADIKVKGEEILEGGLAMLSEDNMLASGSVDIRIMSEYELKNYARENYTYENSRESGQDTYRIEAKDIIIQIFKEQSMNPEEMEKKLQEAMKKGLEDPDAMDKMMNELEAAMSGQNIKQVPVKVIIRLNKAPITKVWLYQYRETWDSGFEPVVKEEEGEVQMPFQGLLSWAFNGTYEKDDDGEDRIIANFEEATLNESQDKDCKPLGSITNSFSFELQRKRIK